MSESATSLRIDLPGGQDRLRQMILYVAQRCHNATRFGGIKLNKILWKSDFDAFAARGVPVTGRAYQRLRLGPAPKEMLPLHQEMLRSGLIRVQLIDFGDGVVEHRTIPLEQAKMDLFTDDDVRFVDRSIRYYWDLTGMETSDDSHGPAWLTRANGEPMPYEAALLSERAPSAGQIARLKQAIYDRGWLSD